MTRVNLPAYSALCWQDETQVDCDYALIIPRKIVASSLLSDFPNVGSLVKNFAISEGTQEQIMAGVNYNNLTLPAAVCLWLKGAESMWKSWIVINGISSTVVVSTGSAVTSVNPVPIAVGVSVGGAALVAAIIAVVIYHKKGKKRRALKVAPEGEVALVFTDIQVKFLF